MKKLQLSQTEIINGGSKCSEAVATLAGVAVGGAIFGGGVGALVGIAFGAAEVYSSCR